MEDCFLSWRSTEITVTAVMPFTSNRSPDEPIPIGVPMPNYSTHILDEDMKLLPPGVPGEIVIGGAGVFSGYLNQVDLSNQKVPNDP
jgi:non-ribosomal peptide synthetase component F